MIKVIPACCVILLSSISSCMANKTPSSGEKFIGGRNAVTGQFPATVKIGRPQLGMHCGAGKIAARKFITAAHCIEGLSISKGSPIEIFYGVDKNRLTKIDAQVINAERTSYNDRSSISDASEASSSYGPDLGTFVINVDTPDIAIATIFKQKLTKGTKVAISGYGCETDQPGSGMTVNERNSSLKFEVNEISTVEKYHYYMNKQGDGREGRVCQGDSGTPAYLYHEGQSSMTEIVGVNSFRVPALQVWTAVAQINFMDALTPVPDSDEPRPIGL